MGHLIQRFCRKNQPFAAPFAPEYVPPDTELSIRQDSNLSVDETRDDDAERAPISASVMLAEIKIAHFSGN